MTFTYDLAANSGLVRLLIPDVDEDNVLFQDAEIDAFLTLENNVVRLAAAQALDTLASSEVMILKVIKVLDVSTNGDRVGKELRERATALREQHEQGVGDPDGMFDIAEWVVDDFGAREFFLGVR